jgi:glutamyl-tRNA reductase
MICNNQRFILAGYRVKDAAVSPLAGRLFVVIGAGGAGKALAYGAKEKGAKVIIANRTYGKFIELLVIPLFKKLLYQVLMLHQSSTNGSMEVLFCYFYNISLCCFVFSCNTCIIAK